MNKRVCSNENALLYYVYKASKRQESEENVKLLRLENESLKSDIAALSAENQTLLLQIAELKHRIEELEMKHKSIFNRR